MDTALTISWHRYTPQAETLHIPAPREGTAAYAAYLQQAGTRARSCHLTHPSLLTLIVCRSPRSVPRTGRAGPAPALPGRLGCCWGAAQAGTATRTQSSSAGTLCVLASRAEACRCALTSNVSLEPSTRLAPWCNGLAALSSTGRRCRAQQPACRQQKQTWKSCSSSWSRLLKACSRRSSRSRTSVPSVPGEHRACASEARS